MTTPTIAERLTACRGGSKTMPLIHTENRWALFTPSSHAHFLELLSHHCWFGGTNDPGPHIRTFPTRKLAREARYELVNCYRRVARVVKVEVVIREVAQAAGEES